MKIYTKRGDAGKTDLLTKRVEKDDLRIDVNGQFDEAMAMILMLKQVVEKDQYLKDLDVIHQFIFDICYEIALDNTTKPIIEKSNVEWVELQIDTMDQHLEQLTKFIKLDQNKAAAWANMVRVTIRRAERRLIILSKEATINANTLALVNRLSDYFFTFGRILQEL